VGWIYGASDGEAVIVAEMHDALVRIRPNNF
jgi:hypothetical protein